MRAMKQSKTVISTDRVSCITLCKQERSMCNASSHFQFYRNISLKTTYSPHTQSSQVLTSSSCDSHSRSRLGNLSWSQAEESSVSLNTIPFSSAQRVPRVSTVRPGTSAICTHKMSLYLLNNIKPLQKGRLFFVWHTECNGRHLWLQKVQARRCKQAYLKRLGKCRPGRPLALHHRQLDAQFANEEDYTQYVL